MTQAAQSPSYHVLLIGIDDYPYKPLTGCVNDIDAIQKLLLERAKVPRERILRLASPRKGAACSMEIPEQPATLSNMKAALRELADRASEGDRVLIYYSGHGTRMERVRSNQQRFHRDALVPVDFDRDPRDGLLLYDHELNERLAEIMERTRSVTCILDCCHSAGATRSAAPGWRPTAPEMMARGFDVAAALARNDALRGRTLLTDDAIAAAVDECQVVTACLNHEEAREAAGDDGKTHGLLTRALLRSLDRVPDAELAAVPWRRIWQKVRADIEGRHAYQHPWMAGDAARAVLAGPPVMRDRSGVFVIADPGFSVRHSGDHYEIDAGTLANVTDEALIAIYGEQPWQFPLVNSEADRRARLGLLRVTKADKSSAVARAEGPRFPVPPDARGRIVAAGQAARLPCAIVPPRADLVAAVAKSPLLEIVEPAGAEVRLEQARNRWRLTDHVHDELGEELCRLNADQLHRACDVLEHYFYYALPLRMARSATDLANTLRLAVLSCPDELAPEVADTVNLAEAPCPLRASMYEVTEGVGICFQVDNRSRERLRIALVNVAASGRVQFLDDQTIDAGHTHRFWVNNEIGHPFAMSVPDGKDTAIDRLIAIGTTGTRDIKYLATERSFADVIRSNGRDFGRNKTPPVERWTATQVIVRTRSRYR
jgi:hypothetical protein